MPAFSGLFDNEPAADGSGGTGHAFQVDRSPIQKRVARALKRRSLRRFGNYMAQLTTSDSPSADVAYSQIDPDRDVGNAVSGGGVRSVSVVTVQSSGTNYDSQDASDADEMGNMSNDPDSYPTDAGGNGGGAKGESTAPGLG